MLDQMRVFERVEALRSFTAAARELGISKATASAQVARLEARLGTRLLHRTTRTVRPTDLGRAYAERCRAIVTEAREADLAVMAAGPQPHGLLRLSCPRLFATAFLTPIVQRYLATWPAVQLELALTERKVDLIEEGFDLAIRLGPLPDSSLVTRSLGRAPMAALAHPDYLAGLAEGATPSWVVVGPRRQVRIPTPGGQLQMEGRVAVDSLEMARDLAIAGLGVALLPRFLCHEALDRGLLVPVPLGPRDWSIGIHALWPAQRQLSARVRAFLDLLVEHTRDDPPWA